MPYKKKIVCLANSRKPPSGRCIAGREIIKNGFGAWIRPVSDRATEEISEEERRYEGGQDPKVLDVISIQFSRPNPHRHQTENHVIDAEYYWEKEGLIPWDRVQNTIEVVGGDLWCNGYSTYYGQNDRIPESELENHYRSLYCVQPLNMRIAVVTEGGEFGNPRRRVRALFNLESASYNLIVTDPVVERQFLAQADGTFTVEDALLCVSLGGVHKDGYAYKLAAAIITPERADE